MKTLYRILALLTLVCLLSGCAAPAKPGEPVPPVDQGSNQPAPAPAPDPVPAPVPAPADPVDYAASFKLDMGTVTRKAEATVKTHVDGDTVHFNVSTDVMPDGVFKARFLAVNTPESTGKIEEYGKKASEFTKAKLAAAESIVLESENENWEADSTGSRHLAWIWYRNPGETEYRNLNVELLQEGLAIGSSAANNQYGSICMGALNQAKNLKLNVFSGQKDPDFYYGDAVELTIKELRTNTEAYNGIKVAFNGVITMNNNSTVYVESYDAETDLWYGMQVYYGYNLSGIGLQILSVGNEVRIVGSVQYYAAGGTWQVSDLNYRMMKPKDPGNIQLVSSGHTGSWQETDPKLFAEGKTEIMVGEETKSFDNAFLALGTSRSMKDLEVVDVYTTTDDSSSSKGAMTLTCRSKDGTTVSVRTVVLYDSSNNLITADAYAGKTIDVRGIVDFFDGSYQIKVFTAKDITIH